MGVHFSSGCQSLLAPTLAKIWRIRSNQCHGMIGDRSNTVTMCVPHSTRPARARQVTTTYFPESALRCPGQIKQVQIQSNQAGTLQNRPQKVPSHPPLFQTKGTEPVSGSVVRREGRNRLLESTNDSDLRSLEDCVHLWLWVKNPMRSMSRFRF